MVLIKTKMIINNGAFLIRRRVLIHWQGAKCLSRQNGNSWAQEVLGMFVKVLTDLVSGKSMSAKLYYTSRLMTAPAPSSKQGKQLMFIQKQSFINVTSFGYPPIYQL